MKPQLKDAINSLVGLGTSYDYEDGKIINWDTSETQSGATQPTEAEIQAEVIRLQAEYDSKQYARDRAKDYAPLADQLDMLWHAIDQGIDLKQSDFYTGNKAVKDAHPKG